jgi:hypothetical protein
MKRVLTVVGMCVFFLSAVPISSQRSAQQREYPSTSGNAFLRWCSSIEKKESNMTRDDFAHQILCDGYVEGFIHGVQMESVYAGVMTGGKEAPILFCFSKVGENAQLVRIVLKYIRNHPEKAQLSGPQLVGEAFQQAFPCGKKN